MEGAGRREEGRVFEQATQAAEAARAALAALPPRSEALPAWQCRTRQGRAEQGSAVGGHHELREAQRRSSTRNRVAGLAVGRSGGRPVGEFGAEARSA